MTTTNHQIVNSYQGSYWVDIDMCYQCGNVQQVGTRRRYGLSVVYDYAYAADWWWRELSKIISSNAIGYVRIAKTVSEDAQRR